MSTECLNLPPVEEPKHMHCSEAPLQLPQGVDSSFPKLEETAWAAALFEKAAAPADFAVVDKVERRNEQNAVFAAGGFHPVDRGPADAAEMVKYMKSWQFQVTGKPAAAVALAEMGCEHIQSGGAASLSVEATKMIEERQLDDTFYMVDLGNVLRMYKAWRAAMPRVVPHYAVKCNPDMGMLKLLAAMGAGFDCASKGEVEMMLRLGVHPSRIIFAHPCKRPTDIRYARDHAVDLTTFDTESELHKIAAMNPRFRCVLRIRADDPEARVPLGLKYGCDTADAPRLLRLAHALGLSVVGVSFHVGSACKNLATFSNAIESAREIFDQGLALGFPMDLLDIGGGFSGRFDAHGNVVFGEIASTINAALAAHFPPESGVRVIAEPGRYFAEAAGTLFTPVYGQRDKADLAGATKKEYFITDGLYGSFNCIIYDGQNPEFQVLRGPGLPAPKEEGDDAPLFKSTLWGPTCDSADCVYKDIMLPELRNGDWLMFPNAGAYTVAGACDFNGIAFTRPTTFYVFSDCAVDLAAGAGAAEGVAAAAAPVAAAAAAAKEMSA